MEEAKAKAIAGGCAGLAILTLGALSLRPRDGIRGRLQVVEQWNGTTSGPQPGMPPGVYLRLETPESDSNQRIVQTHVFDEKGVEYPLETGDFQGYAWIPLGYKRPPRSPRLVANVMTNEVVLPSSGDIKMPPGNNYAAPVKVRELGPIALRDFPTPRETSLPLSKDAPFILRRVGNKVMVEPIPGKLPSGNWELDVLATPYAPTLTVPARYVRIRTIFGFSNDTPSPREDSHPWRASGRGTSELNLPYPQDTDAVKLRLRITRPSERIETVTIPGLRLARKQGETVFEPSAPVRIPTRSGGSIVVSAPPPQRRESKVDHRTPTLWVAFEARDRTEKASKPQIELIAPKPESLGLRGLTLGQWAGASHAPSGPVSDRPFAATLRLVWTTDRTTDIGVYTVPVR